ncbi:response regulator [Niabella sp. W65]|jgi:DNA-binding response OmpR family regulator|nr:response regulator [Niabella sp. W65]MCH7365285.1 response regulator [Niabella sp. W65]ULT41079.1 response regulator [Niabella sp. I65]
MRKRILIADDNPGILDVVSIILESEGYEVRSTADPQHVLQIKDDPPGLILLDIWMGGTDGRNICKQLKADHATRHIPVILMSANSDIKAIAQESGADGFIAKPFEIDELISRIHATYAFNSRN